MVSDSISVISLMWASSALSPFFDTEPYTLPFKSLYLTFSVPPEFCVNVQVSSKTYFFLAWT